MYLNRLTLIGFLGRDAESKQTSTGRTYTVLSIATKSSWKDKETGEYTSRTEWTRCIAWGKLGEWAASLTKGLHLQVEGELRTREWTDRVGKPAIEVKRRIAEMRVDSVLKLDRAEKDRGEVPADAETSDEVPF